MPKPSEQAQIEFIKDCLRKGEQRGEVLAKFVKKWQKVGIRTFDRRLKVSQQAVQSEQKRIQLEAEGNVAKKVEALESKIMTAIERQEILAEMARGELETEVLLVTKDGIKKAKAKPTHAERRAAIAELNKMDGSYSPDKHEHKVEGQLPSWLKTT
jgi:hypothetical protein